MKFEFTRNTLEIREIYKKFNDGEYIVDHSYQRRKVWGEKDNVCLIETILLNLVIPEIFLWPAEIDPENGNTITHIVDGQQRINAIVNFIAGGYSLKKRYLNDEEISDRFGNLHFNELPPEVKTDLWTYSLSIVNIDKKCSLDEVKKMFYRLNVTDYRLNEQEIRNSMDTAFGKVALELSRNDFWDEIKVFSSADVKRMKDVEYCANILILTEEGIVDQTHKKLNQTYDDYKDEYPQEQENIELINRIIERIWELTDESTQLFLSRKAQLYTVFSFLIYMDEEDLELTREIVKKFKSFVGVYSLFKNDISEKDVPTDLSDLFKFVNSYRLASSEGVNKRSNRMIRFEILKKLCLGEVEIEESKYQEMVEYLNTLA
ncbi:MULTISPECIES: DUF262 domain-containing protein [Bacillus cereus group]|uniref:DUF262 domain-containing protein n=2 Tax=Bacteria TaxID=2 RepID=UPI001F57FE88|nr:MULTISPECIES: DUF262 domain-containing protein [Bacillus cereus group]MCU5203800.1 DUF262 domain-containing protein [Bacillus paranthracis]HDR7767802.1 DUF262 domain-containing protein [Bacillus paranthracis]